jgi:hypothetical protein
LIGVVDGSRALQLPQFSQRHAIIASPARAVRANGAPQLPDGLGLDRCIHARPNAIRVQPRHKAAGYNAVTAVIGQLKKC